MKVTYIEIMTWVGYDGSAIHYYGSYTDPDGSIEDRTYRVKIDRELTRKEANRLNRHEKDKFCHYDEGDRSERFFSEKEIVDTVLRDYITDDVDIIIKGRIVLAEPQEIVYVKDNQFDIGIANSLWKRADKLEWVPKEEDEKTDLCREWFKYTGQGPKWT